MLLRTALFVFSFAIACASCGKKTTNKKNSATATQSILPSNTGNLSELVLVISDELWAGSAGRIITDVLQENIKAIPQQEALFNVYNIEANDFSNIFRTHKNVLWISNSENEKFEKIDQMWSKDQLYVHLSNASEEALIDNLKEHIYTIRSWFVEKDQQRRLQKLKTSADKEMEKRLQKFYGLNLTIPKGYQIASSDKDFTWLRKDNPKTNIISNIWLHSQAYLSPEQFNKKNLIALRDSLGKAHVEGSRPQSFMATETLYDPDYKMIKEKPYTLATKGLWTMKNDFLGGPYTAYAILDEEKQKIIYVEGFIYCPGERKRAHIFELEAILSGLKLN
tara:strand:- start:1119 stop:2126 length:1008 start_codon:yes stop_codon:yes gene_type:complete